MEERQVESDQRKHPTGKKAGADGCQQIRKRCRTTLAKRTQGIYIGRRGDRTPLSLSLDILKKSGGQGVLRPEANKIVSPKARGWRTGRGPWAWHVRREMLENLGDPVTSCKPKSRYPKPTKGGEGMGIRESDLFIVLGEWESHLHGEGEDE